MNQKDYTTLYENILLREVLAMGEHSLLEVLSWIAGIIAAVSPLFIYLYFKFVNHRKKTKSELTKERLLELALEAARAVNADIHSISIPKPHDNPSCLQIVHSSDPEAKNIIGKEIPINQGFAWYVFNNREPYFRNEVSTDPKHYDLIDKAAGTNTGEGAILTLPLLSSNNECYGVIQFMKAAGKLFDENDINNASKFTPRIAEITKSIEKDLSAEASSTVHENSIRATVIFTDIGKFSDIASKVRLQTSVDLLNEYYTSLLNPVLENRGILQEYVGDGLFISFSLESGISSAEAAITSAIEMQKEYEKLLHSWKQYNHPISSEVNTHSIGIATGIIHTGLVGHPNEKRRKLIGSAVNLASHLCEEISKTGGGILICNETAKMLESNNLKMIEFDSSYAKAYTIQTESESLSY